MSVQTVQCLSQTQFRKWFDSLKLGIHFTVLETLWLNSNLYCTLPTWWLCYYIWPLQTPLATWIAKSGWWLGRMLALTPKPFSDKVVWKHVYISCPWWATGAAASLRALCWSVWLGSSMAVHELRHILGLWNAKRMKCTYQDHKTLFDHIRYFTIQFYSIKMWGYKKCGSHTVVLKSKRFLL